MIQAKRGGKFLILLDPNKGVQWELSREEAKAICRFLMVEFNVVEFYFREGNSEIAGHLQDKEFQKLVEGRWAKVV